MNRLFKLGHRRLVDEQQRQLGIASDALRGEHVLRQLLPSRAVDRMRRLLVGNEHFDGAFLREASALRRKRIARFHSATRLTRS